MIHTVRDIQTCSVLWEISFTFLSSNSLSYRWLSRLKYRKLHTLVKQNKKKILGRVGCNVFWVFENALKF